MMKIGLWLNKSFGQTYMIAVGTVRRHIMTNLCVAKEFEEHYLTFLRQEQQASSEVHVYFSV